MLPVSFTVAVPPLESMYALIAARIGRAKGAPVSPPMVYAVGRKAGSPRLASEIPRRRESDRPSIHG
jgi:hypothetical protein